MRIHQRGARLQRFNPGDAVRYARVEWDSGGCPVASHILVGRPGYRPAPVAGERCPFCPSSEWLVSRVHEWRVGMQRIGWEDFDDAMIHECAGCNAALTLLPEEL